MHDGISFEQLGKPALVICTHPFQKTGDNIARNMGLAGYKYAMVEHPIGSRTLSELKERANDAYRQGVEILTN
ncbi:MAG: hypothetical protein O7B25_10405 [Gammaproteobacteria bacterium]|nr:hypothetical protein [Gammaproteobacteria bacterium]